MTMSEFDLEATIRDLREAVDGDVLSRNRVVDALLDLRLDAVARADVVIRGTMAAILWVRQAMMTIDEIEKQKLLTIDGPADAVDAVRYLYRLSAVS